MSKAAVSASAPVALRRAGTSAAATEPEALLKGLTPAQLKAVTHTGGPLLIVAGAGTGKTAVITKRLVWLLTKQQMRGDNVLALTFSNKSTQEMEDRVDLMMPMGFEPPWIHTFHGFGERILRDHGLAIGLDPAFKMLTPADQQALIRKNLFAFELDYYRPLGNPAKFIGALVQHFSRAKDEAVDPDHYVKWAKKQLKALPASDSKQEDDLDAAAARELAERQLEVAKAFQTYEQLLAKEGVIDVSDLITKTLSLLRKRPSILKQYRKQFRAILVDEFQDTNFAQFELVRLLAGERPNLTVVADDDQSIYRWRGAAITNVQLFMARYDNAATVALKDNFRSTQGVLDRSYELIQQNNPDRLEVSLKIDKQLTAVRGSGVEPIHIEADTRQREVRYITEQLIDRNAKGRDWKDMAVLVRSNAAADIITAGLGAADVPFKFLASRGLYARPEILDLVAFLRTITDLRDSISLFRLLKTSYIDFPALDLLELLHHSKKHNRSLYEELSDLAEGVGEVKVSDQAQTIATDTLATLHSFVEQAQQVSVGQVLLRHVEHTKLLETWLKTETAENTEQILNVNELLRRIQQFEEANEDKTTRAFLEYFDLMQQAGENPAPSDVEESPDAVHILTVHAAKGLEFPVVFIFNCIHNHFPAINRKDPIELPVQLVAEENRALLSDDTRAQHLAEERRLFYVAMTRARDELICTSSIDTGGVRKHKPSRFIAEAGIKTRKLTGSRIELPAPRKTAQKNRIVKLPLPNHFSYTQLTVFENCPQQYKFAHLYRIPSPGGPTLSYGKSIHEALRSFHLLIQEDQPLPTKQQLLDLLDHCWLSEWYESASHEQKRKVKAREALSKYYDENKASFAPALWIEKTFKLKLGGYTIHGAIDRAERLPDGSIEIIDYKTGSSKTEKQLKKNDQLALYALAAQKVYSEHASKLSWYFIDDGIKVSVSRTPEELKSLEQKVQKDIAAILGSDFVAKPSFACKNCDFKKICEAGQKSGHV